jgi:hypothetical protein
MLPITSVRRIPPVDPAPAKMGRMSNRSSNGRESPSWVRFVISAVGSFRKSLASALRLQSPVYEISEIALGVRVCRHFRKRLGADVKDTFEGVIGVRHHKIREKEDDRHHGEACCGDHPGMKWIDEDQQQEDDDHGAHQEQQRGRDARQTFGDALVALLSQFSDDVDERLMAGAARTSALAIKRKAPSVPGFSCPSPSACHSELATRRA